MSLTIESLKLTCTRIFLCLSSRDYIEQFCDAAGADATLCNKLVFVL